MYYKVILSNGVIIDSDSAGVSIMQRLGFFNIVLKDTNPSEIYQIFSDKNLLREIKLVHFIDKVSIVTDPETGEQTIETSFEQDPKVRIYRGYDEIYSIGKAPSGENNWSVTLTSITPEPEIILEIFKESDYDSSSIE